MNVLSHFADYYSSSYYYTAAPAAAPLSAGAIFLLIFAYFLFIAAIYVVTALFLGLIFKKAGVPRWAAWVPFYNSWKPLEIGGQPGFWAILAIIPIVNIVSGIFMYIAMYHIGLKLGKSGAFVLLAIFLPIVWLIWLAVDHSKWGDTLQAPTQPTPPATPPTPPIAPTV